MNGLIYKLNTDNDYVLPKVAHLIHEARDFDMDVIQATVSQSKPIFIVGRDFSSNDLTLGTPYLTGTVVSIERIEKEQHKSKLFVKGLYRAKVSDQLALFAPDNHVYIDKLCEKLASLQQLKLAYNGLIKKFKEYAKQEDSLRAYQIVEKFNAYDIDMEHDRETMIYYINKLTQIAMYDMSFYPAVNQEIIEEDDIILRATKVELNIEHMMIESYNKAYYFPEYVHVRPVVDDTEVIEEMKTIEMIESVGKPKRIDREIKQTGINNEIVSNRAETNDELSEITLKLNQLNIPKESRSLIDREIDKAARQNKSSNEYREIITYLNLLTNLPWSFEKEDQSIIEAEKMLNESHFGMDRIKKEIIKYLAERKLNASAKGAVLCLAGPPGVGKTSLVRSIANAMNREFIQIKLGGVEREGMIRGFERTYRSAIPGIFIKEMTNIASVNPVILLDEIDKIGGSNGEGDVASALLEVLDPSQNKEFRDHYLAIPYDLSKVLFIATANDLENIPAPLKDRLEILHLDGYARKEKFHIAKYYMIERNLNTSWLKDYQITIDDDVLMDLVDQFSYEPGIRSLERSITSMYREIALKIAKEKRTAFHITTANRDEYINIDNERVLKQEIVQENHVGRVNILKIRNKDSALEGSVGILEVSKFPGNGCLTSTGNLGDVMRESVDVAFSYIRLKAAQLNIDQDFKEKYDFHIHFPEAAVPKDGPSAGIGVVIAIISALTEQQIKYDVTMTGEISLYGNIRSVGGVKEKIIGAYQAGMSKVIIPEKNKEEIKEIPNHIQEKIEVIAVTNVEEVLEHVFAEKPTQITL